MSYVDYVLEFCEHYFSSFLGSNAISNIAVMETFTFVFALLPLVLVPYAIHKFIMLIVRLKNGY